MHTISTLLPLSLLLIVALAGCVNGSEEALPQSIPDLERLPASAIEEYGKPGEFEELRFDGEEFLIARIWADEQQTGPFTESPLAYWWIEIAYDEPELSHHIDTTISHNDLWVEFDGKLIEVGLAKRGFRPQYQQLIAAGDEPEHMHRVDWEYWGFPEATFEEWQVKQGGLYKIRVEKFGSAIEGEDGRPIYETYYHYTVIEKAE